MKKYIKLISVILAAMLLLPVMLASCSEIGYKTKQLPSTELEKQVVGKVGEYTILYDEYCFVVNEYKKELEIKYGKGIWDDPVKAEQYREELAELVNDGIKANYAVLTLCDEYGYKNALDKRDIKKAVDDAVYDLLLAAYIEKYESDKINSKPNGENAESGETDSDIAPETAAKELPTELTHSQLKKAYEYYEQIIRETGLTDRVLRIFLSVEFAEEELYHILCSEELVPYSDDDIWEIMISDEFIRTDHIFLRCENEADFEEKYAKAVEVRDALRAGTPLEDYIRNGTDQDFGRLSTAGYYFTKGEMDPEYEEAAFALEVGEVSDVIRTDRGYFVIKRYEKDVTYMNTHISHYIANVSYAEFNKIVTAKRESLVFELNDYGKTLDILTIAPDSSALPEPADSGN